MIELGVFGVKSERDQTLKAAGLILQVPQGEEVVDAFGGIFDVAVQHGAVRRDPCLVDDAGDVQPTGTIGLVIADFSAHPFGKDLRPAPGTGVEAGVAEARDGFLEAQTGGLGDEVELDHRQCFEVDPGKALLEGAEELLIVIHQKLGMEAADDVELGDRLIDIPGSDLDSLLHRVGPAVLTILPRHVEGAQFARGNADVGWVEVAIDVEVGAVTMQAFTHQIRHAADPKEIVRRGQQEPVLAIEAISGQHLFCYRCNGGIPEPELIDGVSHRLIMLATASRFNPDQCCSPSTSAATKSGTARSREIPAPSATAAPWLLQARVKTGRGASGRAFRSGPWGKASPPCGFLTAEC